MAFKIIFGDICKMKEDAIVNSLGVNAKSMGTICRNIVSCASSDEINELINTKTKNSIYDIFVTGAGNLPSKNIIHIVTPFKCYDDEENSSLKKAFKIIIEKAIEMKFKSIAIPFIGTGANGYKNSDIYSAVTSVVTDYVDDNPINDKINITLAIYNKKSEDRIRKEYPEDGKLIEVYPNIQSRRISNLNQMEDSCVEPVYMPSQVKHSIDLNKIFYKANREDMFIPEDRITTPMDFIDCYAESNKIKKKDFDFIISKDHASRCRLGQRTLTKREIYKCTIYFGWTITMCLQLMTFAGYSFTPLDKIDILFVEYLLLKKKAKNYYDFIDNFGEYYTAIF